MQTIKLPELVEVCPGCNGWGTRDSFRSWWTEKCSWCRGTQFAYRAADIPYDTPARGVPESVRNQILVANDWRMVRGDYGLFLMPKDQELENHPSSRASPPWTGWAPEGANA